MFQIQEQGEQSLRGGDRQFFPCVNEATSTEEKDKCRNLDKINKTSIISQENYATETTMGAFEACYEKTEELSGSSTF